MAQFMSLQSQISQLQNQVATLQQKASQRAAANAASPTAGPLVKRNRARENILKKTGLDHPEPEGIA
ncbi:hypothetical protein HDU98_006076, partial [Podochytrium sp. JEL0797]